MISLLCPTRNRARELTRMVESVRETVSWGGAAEVVTYVSPDGASSEAVATSLGCRVVVGSRRPLGELWNRCAENARGELLMQVNDDVVFRTPAWDEMVEREFAACEDKILMVYGDDLGCHRAKFGPHPIVHRRWVDTVGYFVPGCFAGDYTDTWVNDVAEILGRRRFLPFIVEHMHHLFEKGVVDDTYRERQRAEATENWGARYLLMEDERRADAAKLRAVMA